MVPQYQLTVAVPVVRVSLSPNSQSGKVGIGKHHMMIFNKPSDADDIHARTLPGVGLQFVGVGLVGAVAVCALAFALVGDVTALVVGLALYAVVMGVALTGLAAGFPHRVIGLCNVATIARLVLVCALVAALVAQGAPGWVVFCIAVVAFALDGLDGWLARRARRASSFGARFDMEVDSLLALVLALLAWQSGSVGVYVIVLGLPRYVFWIAQFPFPWLNGDLPERFSRKVVCVVQIAALILALFPQVPTLLASLFAGVAAVVLVWSFWLDVRVLKGARA